MSAPASRRARSVTTARAALAAGLVLATGHAPAADAAGTEPGDADRPDRASGVLRRFARAGGTLSLRAARFELDEPIGYDVDYDDIEGTALEGVALGLRRRTRLLGARSRRDELILDRRDHDGLDLQSLAVGEQLQWSLPGSTGRGPGLALGGALGLTRARSFTDASWHPMIELNASLTWEIDPLRLELTSFRRATGEAELDGRDADPGTSGVRLAIVLGRAPRRAPADGRPPAPEGRRTTRGQKPTSTFAIDGASKR